MSKRLKMKLLLILTALILTSCATTAPEPIRLNLPPELVLPRLKDPHALDCVPEESYKIIVTRDKLQTERRKTLRSIMSITK